MIKSDEVKQKYQEVIDSVTTERDELKVKMHLARMEVQDEWTVVEEKWQKFKSKNAQLEHAVSDSAHEIGEAMSILGGELKESYKRFKKVL
jgi:hypothetical protein